MIISHILPPTDDSHEWQLQSNDDHQKNVSSLAAAFASKFGMVQLARIAGRLHDVGKEQQGFQNYIKKMSGYEPSIKAEKTPHAAVGASVAQGMYNCSLISEPIFGHHTGLKDESDFRTQLKETVIPSDVGYASIIREPLSRMNIKAGRTDINHIMRMLFSCLTDADFLDTEAFMNNENARLRNSQLSLKQLWPKLQDFLEQMRLQSTDSPVNRIRQEIQLKCREAANLEPGFFSLTVPTGGGKTLSSLVWAMLHAIKYVKDRIIIAIPYTSIITQTAQTLRKIFGDENVLEHHSNIDLDKIENPVLRLKMKLATENWDCPIVVTTNVQLFQSMFANKSSKCRKLHNICNSVVILDEAQSLPRAFLQPIVDALDTYRRIFGVSVLLSTASQPVLTEMHKGTTGKEILKGLQAEAVREIIPRSMNLHDALRRVDLHFDVAPSTYDHIAERLMKHNRVLCIVNTRTDAHELFVRLPQDGTTLHLSRMMCSRHISYTIDEIKRRLLDGDEHLRVVATQLVEAGVDIDFPVVFRQKAGLDSILQAAGRCNREGRLPLCGTTVFGIAGRNPHGEINDGINALNNLADVADWFAPETMTRYFNMLFSYTETCDKKQICQLLNNPGDINFETASREFRLIEDDGVNVVVNYGDGPQLIEDLKINGPSYRLMKQLGQYTVGLHKRDFEKMLQAGLVEEPIEGVLYIPDAKQYDPMAGLIVDNHWVDEILMI